MVKTFKEHFKERLELQGKKIDYRFKNRPIAKKRYETIMTVIGAVIMTYLVFSLMCVIYVIGEWW